MADGGYNDRDRGRRRRRRGMRREWQDHDYEREDDSYYTPAQPPARPPIILAKPPRERAASRDSPGLSGDDLGHSPRSEQADEGHEHSASSTSPSRPMVVLKSSGPRSSASETEGTGQQFVTSAAQSIPTMLAGDNLPQHLYQVQKRTSVSTNQSASETMDVLLMPAEMSRCVKLVDETLMWCETGTEMLLDQTDFQVIGVLGLQGSGKSTLLSHLAGVHMDHLPRRGVFPVQNRETRELCGHQTVGVDMIVTPERSILLDSQPILSASVLDQLIRQDIKYPAEYTSTENCIEMQSLQLAAFMMTVCHVVIITLEGFSDISVFRFLQTAEMLKPATPQSHDLTNEDSPELFPHVVFIVNRADMSDFTVETYTTMQSTISRLLQQSNLKYKGPCNMRSGQLISGLHPDNTMNNVNLFLLPQRSSAQNSEEEDEEGLMSDFQGHPGFEAIMESLTNKILSMPRQLLTHTTLSEKNWFHYAARTWEGVKKSGLMSEYNRLLP